MTRSVFFSFILAVSLVAAAIVVGPSIVAAQPAAPAQKGGLDTAKKHMERGQELYMQQKYAEAAEAFAAAYAIQSYAAFLYNEAVCHQKLGHNERALSLFEKYLSGDPNAPDAEKVRGRIARIKEALGGGEPGDAGVGEGGAVVAPGDAGSTIVDEEGPDLMKSLVIVESDPANAPVTVFFRVDNNAPAYEYGKPNAGWSQVTTGRTPLNATLQLGRYHIVMEPFEDFHRSETDIDVAAGRVHQFKANLRQGEFMAFLRITSPIPGARIYVDDPPPHKKPPWGLTPHEGLIGVGDHRVWVARAGYETSSRTFSVAHGEEREELIDLGRITKGRIRIEGNAASIQVDIDGRSVGVYAPGAPIELELSSGRHSVAATADGRKDLSADIEVPKGQILPVDLVMMPTTPRGAAWTQAAVSLAFLGGGVALGMRSDSVYDDLKIDREAGVLTEDDDRYTKGKIYAISSTACFGVSGVLAVLSGYNFIKDPTPDSGVRPGTPVDYPDTPTAEPGARNPSAQQRLPLRVLPPQRSARRSTPPPIFSEVSLQPASGMSGAGLMLQGRF